MKLKEGEGMETILLGVYIGEFSWEGKGYKGSDKRA